MPKDERGILINLAVGKAALYTPTASAPKKYPSITVSVQPMISPAIPASISGYENVNSSLSTGSALTLVRGKTFFSRK